MFGSSEFRGYFFALIGAFALANVYIFSKAALNEIQLAQFGTYWFGLGMIWNLIYILVRKKHHTLKGISRNNILAICVIGMIELVATVIFFITIKIIANPAIVSFIANLNPFFVVLLGVGLLRERFNFIEILGMVLTLGGSLIISYQPQSIFGDFFIKGAELVMISSLLYAVSIIMAKRTLRNVDPSILSVTRVGFLFFFFLIMLIIMKQSMIIPNSALKNIFIGSLLGPFLNSITIYIALKYIDASKATMIRSIRSVFVLIAAYIYFSTFPEIYQLVGGIISILGVVIISYGQIRKRNKKSTINPYLNY